jgi:hypothetical protein
MINLICLSPLPGGLGVGAESSALVFMVASPHSILTRGGQLSALSLEDFRICMPVSRD